MSTAAKAPGTNRDHRLIGKESRNERHDTEHG
jgi:hypothetical protein